MGLDFEVVGVTLSKRKVEQKGLQHFVNNFRYIDVLKKNKYEEFNFEIDFRRPDYLMDLLLRDAEEYRDSINEDYEGIYVLTKDKIIDLINSEMNEQTFKNSNDRSYYHSLMSYICDLAEYDSKHNDFYMFMLISA
ncbi:hypothetical protein PCV68_001016 [Staphylococcus pseudintermedius]|nr:hypothetical protein [Staphylococcus pseudintermedius]